MGPGQWVENELSTLGELNSHFSLHLHKLLRENHKIHLWHESEGEHFDKRGTAIFVAFDPWKTCLRVAPKSFKYFQASQRHGILTARQSLDLSMALIECCAAMQTAYNGAFAYFFENPNVQTFLRCKGDRALLADTEMTLGISCADAFYEALPWPLRPNHHLIARNFPLITFDPSNVPDAFSGLSEAIEFTCWGPWIGFCVESITKILSTLQSNSIGQHPKVPRISGYRMIMPFFSNGFQGAIVGFFFGIDNTAAELIRSELMQFGQTLADKWALLRQQSFNQVIRNSGDPKQVAEGLLKIVSPVDYIVVDCAGRSAGYRLRREQSYFAGYERLRGLEIEKLKRADPDIFLPDAIAPLCTVRIKTLSGHTTLDKEFTRARLEMALHHLMPKTNGVAGERMTFDRLKAHHDDLQDKLSLGLGSHATHRQYYVIKKMIDSFGVGSAAITNHEVKTYFGTLGDGYTSGYQISSHALDVQKILKDDVEIRKTRKGITISWKN